MYGLSLETRTSNSKSEASTVLELLTFHAQKFKGSLILATPLFEKIRDHARTVPGNMYIKFEVRSFNRLNWCD